MRAFLDARTTGRLVGLRTSGTAGQPRTVVRAPGSWTRSFGQVAELTALGASSVLWVPGPVTATMNLFAATLARHLGIPVTDEPRQATHAHLAPLALERALDGSVSLDGMRVTVAGDRLSRSLRCRAEAAGARVSHYYGASELSFVAWGSDEDDLRPFPGVEVQIRDGEIWVRSPYLSQGYDPPSDPTGPLRQDREGFATVGDRGALADGVLKVTGRGDDAVTTGGATVHVADVEATLRVVAGGEVVVLGLPHGTLGQVVAAVLTHPSDLSEAHDAARSRLAPAQRPRLWFHVPILPSTPAGKVDRAGLRDEVTGPHAVPLVPRRSRSVAP